MAKAIGGFFELELNEGAPYYEAVGLNSGRNAFKLLLTHLRPARVMLPLYTCDAMLSPLNSLGIPYKFYPISEHLCPVIDVDIASDTLLVFNNYFGLDTIGDLSDFEGKHILIDNSQAFFSPPPSAHHSFYSPRKFFGVPDGGYLYSTLSLKYPDEREIIGDRISFLSERIESGPEAVYDKFKQSEQDFNTMPIRLMSKVSERILGAIDYQSVEEKRLENFRFLHHALSELNLLTPVINKQSYFVPMSYPLWFEKKGLREYLVSKKIYVTTFWENIGEWARPGDIEYSLYEYLVPIPIDQRYSEDDMERVLNEIKKFLAG